MQEARWRIFQDPSTLAYAAADKIVAAIETGGERPAVCLTGGSSPRRLYAMLAERSFARQIPWRNVHWFVGDERFVPQAHEFSNMGQARRLFLDRHAPAENVHSVQTEASDVHVAAAGYESELKAFHDQLPDSKPIFSLVLLGVGTDGHVASLFPAAAAAAEKGRWVVGVQKPHLAPHVPRVTLTMPALSSCDKLMFIASEPDKKPILTAIAGGANVPATTVTSCSGTSWFVAEAASPSIDALGPRLILVMGVSGAGKTTIGSLLAHRIGWSFLDADDLHSEGSKAKMRAGLGLTDDDRSLWLGSVANAIQRVKQRGDDLVLACSALKARYRHAILSANARHRVVYLRGAQSLIAARIDARQGHFMPASLLRRQVDELEAPGAHPSVLEIDIASSADSLVTEIEQAFLTFIAAGRI